MRHAHAFREDRKTRTYRLDRDLGKRLLDVEICFSLVFATTGLFSSACSRAKRAEKQGSGERKITPRSMRGEHVLPMAIYSSSRSSNEDALTVGWLLFTFTYYLCMAPILLLTEHP